MSAQATAARPAFGASWRQKRQKHATATAANTQSTACVTE
jgi:hypothetical protein